MGKKRNQNVASMHQSTGNFELPVAGQQNNNNLSMSVMGINESFYMQGGQKLVGPQYSPGPGKQANLSVTKYNSNSSKWLPVVQNSTDIKQ